MDRIIRKLIAEAENTCTDWNPGDPVFVNETSTQAGLCVWENTDIQTSRFETIEEAVAYLDSIQGKEVDY